MTVIIDDTQNDKVVSETGEQLTPSVKKRGRQPVAAKPPKLSYNKKQIEGLISVLRGNGYVDTASIPHYKLHNDKLTLQACKLFYETKFPKELQEKITPENIKEFIEKASNLQWRLSEAINSKTRFLHEGFYLQAVYYSEKEGAIINAPDLPQSFKQARAVMIALCWKFIANPTDELLEEMKKQNNAVVGILYKLIQQVEGHKPAF